MGVSRCLNEIPVGEGGYLFPLFQCAFGPVMRGEPCSQRREGNANLVAHQGSSGIVDVILKGHKYGKEPLDPAARREEADFILSAEIATNHGKEAHVGLRKELNKFGYAGYMIDVKMGGGYHFQGGGIYASMGEVSLYPFRTC